MDQQRVKEFLEKKAEGVVENIEKTPAKKLITSVLVLVSFGVIFLGYLQIRTQLDKPFLADKLIEDKGKIRGPREFLEFYKKEQANKEEILTLQQRDSDVDGLSDYQEIYIYRSSAYNTDSDSDGLSDYDEISKNEDPNCPTGQKCDEEGFVVQPNSNIYQEGVLQSPESVNGGGLSENVLLNSLGASSGVSTTLSQDEKDQLRIYFNSLSGAELKDLLKQQGYPVEQLAGISDEDLKKILQSTIDSL